MGRLLQNFDQHNQTDLEDLELFGTKSVTLDGWDFSGLDLSGISFDGFLIVSSTFEEATLSKTSFEDSRIISCNFRDADLNGSDLSGYFINSSFREAEINNTSLEGDYTYSDFTGTKGNPAHIEEEGFFATNTDFEHSYPERTENEIFGDSVDLKGPPEKEILVKSNQLLDLVERHLESGVQRAESENSLIEELKEITESDSDLITKHKRKFEWSVKKNNYVENHGRLNLDGIELNGDLSKIDLTGTTMRGTNLSGSDLVWSNLSGVPLVKTDLSGANLKMASLRGALPIKADFSGSKLCATRARGTNYIMCDFEDAVFEYTGFQGTSFLESYFNDAKIYSETSFEEAVIPMNLRQQVEILHETYTSEDQIPESHLVPTKREFNNYLREKID